MNLAERITKALQEVTEKQKDAREKFLSNPKVQKNQADMSDDGKLNKSIKEDTEMSLAELIKQKLAEKSEPATEVVKESEVTTETEPEVSEEKKSLLETVLDNGNKEDLEIVETLCEIAETKQGAQLMYEILEAVCISAMDHIRVDLPLDPDKCEDIFQRMRTELPECPDRG